MNASARAAQSPFFCGCEVFGFDADVGQRRRWSGVADRLADLHDLADDLLEMLVVGHFCRHLVELGTDLQVQRDGFAVDLLGQNVLRAVTGMGGISAHTVGFSAPAHDRRQAAGTEVADVGQLGMQSAALGFEVRYVLGWRHGEVASSESLTTPRLATHDACFQTPPTLLSHTHRTQAGLAAAIAPGATGADRRSCHP